MQIYHHLVISLSCYVFAWLWFWLYRTPCGGRQCHHWSVYQYWNNRISSLAYPAIPAVKFGLFAVLLLMQADQARHTGFVVAMPDHLADRNYCLAENPKNKIAARPHVQ